MAKKTTNKVSVRAFEKVVKEVENKETTFEWNGLEITVRTTISFQDTLNFVSSVVNSCFDDNTGKYLPEIKTFMIKLFVLTYFTNISLPSNPENAHSFIYNTDIFDEVASRINKQQFHELCGAIDDKIDYLVNSRIEEIEQELVGLSNAIAEVQEKTANIFNGVTESDIQNIIGAITNGKLDEEKLMNAYFANKGTEDVGE